MHPVAGPRQSLGCDLGLQKARCCHCGNWVKGTCDLPVHFFVASWVSIIISKEKGAASGEDGFVPVRHEGDNSQFSS